MLYSVRNVLMKALCRHRLKNIKKDNNMKITGRKIMKLRHSWDFDDVKDAAKPRGRRSRKITRLKGVKVRSFVNRMFNKTMEDDV